MAVYSDTELRYARPLATALIADPTFRAWFAAEPALSAASHDPELQSKLRSAGMKNPYWFNYWCGKDANCACRIGSGIETDILLVFKRPDDGYTALHVEVKRAGDSLGNGQAESYPRRAACWRDPLTRPRTVPAHDKTRLVLVHGFASPPEIARQSFNVLWSHEEIAQNVRGYPER
jgi:hypothetical protein